MDPELALKDRVDLEHAGEKEAQKFAPREDNYDPTSDHAKGSSGEKVCIQNHISIVCKLFRRATYQQVMCGPLTGCQWSCCGTKRSWFNWNSR